MKSNKITQSLACGCAALLLLSTTACGPSENDSTAAPEASLTETLFLKERPDDIVSVSELRAQPSPSSEVSVSGVIGGTLEPFVEGYAALVLADPSVMFCNENPDDNCATPWDACCEDPDILKAKRLSVQFVDADNQIRSTSLRGLGGLKELSEIVVTGTISEDSTHENINLLAKNLFLVQE